MHLKKLWWALPVIAAAVGVSYQVSCVDTTTNDSLCPRYCQDIAATCSGDDLQYPDDAATCSIICSGLDGGTAGIAGENTVSCRDLNVSNAKDESDPAKRHLDCVGGGVSAIGCGGDQCSIFCAVVLEQCGALTGYTDVADCVSTCETWPQSFDGPLIGSTGDTLQCRTYHFELSQTGNPDDHATHCPHTGKVSARCFNTDGGSDGGASDGGSDSASDAPSDASGQ